MASPGRPAATSHLPLAAAIPLLAVLGCADTQADADAGDASSTNGSSNASTTGSSDGAETSAGPETGTSSSSTTSTDPDGTGTTSSSSGSTDATTGEIDCADMPLVCAQAAEARAAQALADVSGDPDALMQFLVAMPLGGDLHHHLSGGVYAETYLAWAEADGIYCIQSSDTSLSTSCGDGNDVPVPASRRELYLDVVRAWSMFDFDPDQGQSAADHFFATFSKFGAISGTQHGRMLADIRTRAFNENVSYIEPMLTSNSTARSLGESTWTSLGGGSLGASDYPTLHAALLGSPGFPEARARLGDDIDDSEAALGCDDEAPPAACDVVTYYQAYISRSGSDAGIFGQMVAAYESAIVEPRLVGLNLVGPEDGSTAMANYDRLMAMLEYLGEFYADVSPLRLSLHAGEITAASIPPQYQLDEAQHVRKAVEIAGARRIGHGVDVLDEGDPTLLDTLHDQGVLVEICLASNDIILEVSGAAHPLHDYLDAGVPVALATDDQGVSRSSLAAEYARAVTDQGLDYLTLKLMARASLEYSFLPGQSLWADDDAGTIVDDCAPAPGDTPVTQPPSPACQALLDDNPRARLQRDLEARFEAFESGF